MNPLPTDQGHSIAGTGWVGAGVNIGLKKFRLVSAVVESTDNRYAESAYIRLSPMVATPAVATLNPSAIAVKHGLVMNGKDLAWIPNAVMTGPLQILGFVYHNSSISHSIRVNYEEES